MSDVNKLIAGLDSGAKEGIVKRYIQFSKIIIVLVTSLYSLMCFGSIVLCYLQHDTENVVEVIKAYGNFAIVAFSMYSLNSIGEKVLTKLYGTTTTTTASSNG